MKTLIIGAAGMLGRKLTNRLIDDAQINAQPLSSLMLVDIVAPSIDAAVASSTEVALESIAADLTIKGTAENLISHRPDIIYHLAAVVSGEAEADMEKGYLVNMDGTRFLLEAIRALHEQDGYTPKIIFTSSIAVYGAPFPEPIGDEFHLTPMTSYGTQKAICELLLADYNRRSIIQGVGLRLPTLCIRPGKANLAASSFFSNIIREPINGQQAILPVDPDVRHWFASPRAAVSFLIQAATLSRDQVGARCNFNLPGLCATVGEQIESLARVAGSDAASLIVNKPDPVIRSIVKFWPQSFDAKRAGELGFSAEKSFDELIRVYLEDDHIAA